MKWPMLEHINTHYDQKNLLSQINSTIYNTDEKKVGFRAHV